VGTNRQVLTASKRGGQAPHRDDLHPESVLLECTTVASIGGLAAGLRGGASMRNPDAPISALI
jgi:hypothetical protein